MASLKGSKQRSIDSFFLGKNKKDNNRKRKRDDKDKKKKKKHRKFDDDDDDDETHNLVDLIEKEDINVRKIQNILTSNYEQCEHDNCAICLSNKLKEYDITSVITINDTILNTTDLDRKFINPESYYLFILTNSITNLYIIIDLYYMRASIPFVDNESLIIKANEKLDLISDIISKPPTNIKIKNVEIYSRIYELNMISGVNIDVLKLAKSRKFALSEKQRKVIEYANLQFLAYYDRDINLHPCNCGKIPFCFLKKSGDKLWLKCRNCNRLMFNMKINKIYTWFNL